MNNMLNLIGYRMLILYRLVFFRLTHNKCWLTCDLFIISESFTAIADRLDWTK